MGEPDDAVEMADTMRIIKGDFELFKAGEIAQHPLIREPLDNHGLKSGTHPHGQVAPPTGALFGADHHVPDCMTALGSRGHADVLVLGIFE